MKTSELLEQLQNSVVLDLNANEIPCPKCKGLLLYYVENNGKKYVEFCRDCYNGKHYICEYCGKQNITDECSCDDYVRKAYKIKSENAKKKLDENYEKAKKLTPYQYDGWVYTDVTDYYDGYFSSIDELKQHCENKMITPPKWVYCCNEQKHILDIENALEHMLDDAYEGAEEHLIDAEGLYEFIEKWNAKQNIVSYYPDYKRVVVLE